MYQLFVNKSIIEFYDWININWRCISITKITQLLIIYDTHLMSVLTLVIQIFYWNGRLSFCSNVYNSCPNNKLLSFSVAMLYFMLNSSPWLIRLWYTLMHLAVSLCVINSYQMCSYLNQFIKSYFYRTIRVLYISNLYIEIKRKRFGCRKWRYCPDCVYYTFGVWWSYVLISQFPFYGLLIIDKKIVVS